MLDEIKLWFLFNRDAILFTIYGGGITLIAWTCGLITRNVVETFVKEDCEC
ncbi:hypothetical protein ACFU7T_11870 [Streptomyces sp. NPDC057555]|uniref:hypothetical protein n=1 Tax=Streptomyces sp. NPDC057555 TaxID=3346166 RepID=UPI0036B1382B